MLFTWFEAIFFIYICKVAINLSLNGFELMCIDSLQLERLGHDVEIVKILNHCTFIHKYKYTKFVLKTAICLLSWSKLWAESWGVKRYPRHNQACVHVSLPAPRYYANCMKRQELRNTFRWTVIMQKLVFIVMPTHYCYLYVLIAIPAGYFAFGQRRYIPCSLPTTRRIPRTSSQCDDHWPASKVSSHLTLKRGELSTWVSYATTHFSLSDKLIYVIQYCSL